MAFYTHGVASYTPVAHANGASALANNSYQAVRGGAATALARVTDVYIGGQATTSTVNQMALRRLSTNATTPADEVPGPLNIYSPAAVSQGYVTAATGPTIASTAHLLDAALNTFGGIMRWVPPPGEEIYFGTTTAPNAQVCLDSISGTGLVGQSVKWEEM